MTTSADAGRARRERVQVAIVGEAFPEFSYAFTHLFHCKCVTFPTRFLIILHCKFVTLFPPAQVDNRFVKVLTVNIYRTLPECFATMDYLSTVNPKHQTRNPKP